MSKPPYFIVSSVDENFVYDFVEARDIIDISKHHSFGVRVIRPHLLDNGLVAPDIRIRPLENMFNRCELDRLISEDGYLEQYKNMPVDTSQRLSCSAA